MALAAADRRAAEALGRRAEALAAWWLRLKGWRIAARNFRVAGGEVDILARRGGVLAAVEVKWRASRDAAAEAVAPRQRHRVAAAASLFWSRLPEAGRPALRFDAVLLAPWRLPHHIEDAWRPD